MLLGACPGPLDLQFGRLASGPGGSFDRLAGLEVLVDLEEVLDLEPVEFREMAQILEVLEAGIVCRDRDYLVVRALLVGHPEHADCPGPYDAARKRGLLD